LFIYQEHFYHNHDGFLEYRIKNVRATQDQRRRKRKAEENDVPSAMEVEDVPLNQEEEEVAQEKVNASQYVTHTTFYP